MSVPLAGSINASSTAGFWNATGTLHYAVAYNGGGYTRGDWAMDTLTRYVGIRKLQNGAWRYGYLKTKKSSPGYTTDLYVTTYAIQSVVTAAKIPQLAGVEMYPNPTTEQLTIRVPIAAARVEVLDLTSRLLRQQMLVGGGAAGSVSLAGLPAGIYVVRLQTAAGTVTQRITKL